MNCTHHAPRCRRLSYVLACACAAALLAGLAGCQSTPRESSTIAPMSRTASSGGAEASAGAETPAINISQAEAMKDEGQQHLARSEWRAARDAFRLAIDANPFDEEAIEGYNLALAMMDEGSGLDRVAESFSLRRQQALTLFDSAVAGAYEAMGNDNLGLAQRRLLEARARLVRNEDVLEQNEYEPRLRAVNDALRRLDKARELSVLTRQQDA